MPLRPMLLCATLGGLLLPTGDSPLGSSPAEEPSLSALLADYRSVAPAPRGNRVHDRTVSLGHLDLYFEDGSLFPLRTSGGTTLGLLFRGRGRYTYHAVDPGDRQALAENLAHRTIGPKLQNSAVADGFSQMILFFAAPVFQELWTAGSAEGVPTRPDPATTIALGPQDRTAFGVLWKRVQKTYLPYDHLAAEARLNGDRGQYVMAEIDGKLKTIGYTYDRMNGFEERLFFFREESQLEIRLEDPLSAQSIEGGAEAHPSGLVMKEAQIQVTTEDNRRVRITSDLILEVTGEGLGAARLDLLNNRSPSTYDWADTRNQLRINRITDETGQDLLYSHRYHQVLVQLRRPVSRGGFVNLRFDTEGEILTGPQGKHYDDYYELMSEPWYPNTSHRGSPGFLFTLKVKARKPYLPVASGSTTSFKEAGDSYELETTSDYPARSIAVFAGKYVAHEEKFGERSIRAYTYSSGGDAARQKLPGLADSILSFYEKNLGSYPAAGLGIVEIPEYGFRSPPAGLALITSDVFIPYNVVSSQKAYRQFLTRGGANNGIGGVNARLAHEIAHQWFLHKAMPASRRDAWLPESLAEYLSGLALAAVWTDEADGEGFPNLFARWNRLARDCRDAGALEEADTYAGAKAANRFCLLNNRGPLVLHMLRTLASDERFFEILRRFLDQAPVGGVTTEDFRKAVEEVLQADMRWFFDSWYHKGGIPEIHAEHRIETTRDGITLLARATQTDGPDFKKIVIPFVVEYAGGKKEIRLLFQDRPLVEARFVLSGEPQKVSVDPGQTSLAIYH